LSRAIKKSNQKVSNWSHGKLCQYIIPNLGGYFHSRKGAKGAKTEQRPNSFVLVHPYLVSPIKPKRKAPRQNSSTNGTRVRRARSAGVGTNHAAGSMSVGKYGFSGHRDGVGAVTILSVSKYTRPHQTDGTHNVSSYSAHGAGSA